MKIMNLKYFNINYYFYLQIHSYIFRKIIKNEIPKILKNVIIINYFLIHLFKQKSKKFLQIKKIINY